ncbi:MAG: two-component system, chemotaxis family, protein-glutamate methylesterase/glutaminase [Gaiellaceae bacterium]|nr:two-component system, chemotaxis family, protein-glutamate methylesterase/glutaminase [Gaiellaceae bacterium]
MSYELAVIGASWGGLNALETVLPALPLRELDLAVAVAQHRSIDSQDGALGELLSRASGLAVQDADDKEPIVGGRIYLAPPDYHLLVEPGSFALSVDERVQYARPSVDVLFESAADAYGTRLIGIILTGANADGAEGLRRIKQRGGVAIVQAPESAERPEMPSAALAATDVDAVLPLEEIAPYVVELCTRARTEAARG